ncbi:hypothetical protein AAG906_012008 [Vitis piasezkii]
MKGYKNNDYSERRKRLVREKGLKRPIVEEEEVINGRDEEDKVQEESKEEERLVEEEPKKLSIEEEEEEPQRRMEISHEGENEQSGRIFMESIIEILSDEMEIQRMKQISIDLLEGFRTRIREINDNMNIALLHIKSVIAILSNELEIRRRRMVHNGVDFPKDFKN